MTTGCGQGTVFGRIGDQVEKDPCTEGARQAVVDL